jgi:hypothetical protein
VAHHFRHSGIAQVRFVVLACLGAIAVAGCSRKPPLAQVEGTVRLDGRPLPDALVCFLPDPERGAAGPRSVAVTDESGHFQLRCDDQRDGAVLGWHRVLLEDMSLYSASRQDGAGGSRPTLASRLPTQYTTTTQTPLSFEVKPGTQTIDLDLKSRP